MSKARWQASHDAEDWRAQLAALDMGDAFEMLRLRLYYLWFGADLETPFPAWLEGYVGPVLRGIETLAEYETVDEAKRVLADAENDFNAAWSDYRAKWLDEEHRRQIRFLQDSDPECVPDDWASEHSPLTWECWAKASASLWQAALFLLEPLPICFRVGALCARVEGLPLGLATQTSIPGELYPITATQHALMQLASACQPMTDLNIELGGGPANVDFTSIKVRCRALHTEIRRRLTNMPANVDQQQRIALQQAENEGGEAIGSRPALRPKPTKDRYTPPELARQWGVSANKIREWIQAGELAAIDVSTTQGGRPRYQVTQGAIATFEARRQIQSAPEPTPRRNRRDEEDGVIQFF